MKHEERRSTGGSAKATMLVAASAFAIALVMLAQPAAAQIANTKHNLTATNSIAGANKTDSADICVFCHTPHGANTGVTAPLWNRPAGTATYTTYQDVGGGTLDGTVLAVGSVSLACLSCHDGTQAMDTVLNAPGSGGYNAAGARMAGITWSGTRVDTATGRLLGTVVSNLGTDLSNDHPIGIPYGGGPGATAGSTKDPDFRAISSGTIGGATRYWVDTPGFGTAGQRDKTDMVLYARTDGGALTNTGYVECATCHDPHVDTAPTGQGMFLRIANAASAVCLACHIK